MTGEEGTRITNKEDQKHAGEAQNTERLRVSTQEKRSRGQKTQRCSKQSLEEQALRNRRCVSRDLRKFVRLW